MRGLGGLLRVAVAVSVVGGCTAPTPTDAPGVDGSAPAPSATIDLTVRCGGRTMIGMDIDYVADAAGVTDVLAATRARAGVWLTDQVILDGDSDTAMTVVVRGGEAVWRGRWFRGRNGWLLGSVERCSDSGIDGSRE